ncbi:MAG: hypothetical protein ACP5KB_07075, partial [Thermoprotei archaeon]
GVLEPGKKADLIVLKPPKTKLIGLLDDPYTTVVYNLGDESINDVYVNGKKIISNRVPLRLDAEKLYEQLVITRAKLFEEAKSC